MPMRLYKPGRSSVAPLAGSVDRNHFPALPVIEVTGVAPLAGSVDRNQLIHVVFIKREMSLPSRGAWIEILWGLPW